MEFLIDQSTAEAAVLGGAVFGGGSGGKVTHGLRLAQQALALGTPRIVTLHELPADAPVATVSTIGAHSFSADVLPEHYVRALTLLQEASGQEMQALISSENGAVGSINGWVQSALLGLPVADAPANGRGHPLGAMGGLGLQARAGYVSIQAAAGPGGFEYVARGPLYRASAEMREAAARAGVMVAVAANPAPVAYVQANGALGALEQAISIGQGMMSNRFSGCHTLVEGVVRRMGGASHGVGVVESIAMTTADGFDRGSLSILLDHNGYLDLTFCNGFMTLDVHGQRRATFPDLITVIGMDCLPCVCSDIREGQRLYVMSAPMEHLPLGRGVFDPALYAVLERQIGQPLLAYLEGKLAPVAAPPA